MRHRHPTGLEAPECPVCGRTMELTSTDLAGFEVYRLWWSCTGTRGVRAFLGIRGHPFICRYTRLVVTTRVKHPLPGALRDLAPADLLDHLVSCTMCRGEVMDALGNCSRRAPQRRADRHAPLENHSTHRVM